MGRYCSYQLPYCPGKMAELSQREVVTEETCHPVHLSKSSSMVSAGSARRMVIVSWGRPGQDGEGHVNGQSPEAVEGKMRGRGWEKGRSHMTSAWILDPLPPSHCPTPAT